MSETRAVGDEVLDEVSPILTAAEGAQSDEESCAFNAQGYRPCFDLAALSDAGAPGAGEPVDIRVQRLALLSIESYALMLSDVSAGRPADETRARLDALDGLVQAVAGLVPPATGALAGLPLEALKSAAAKLRGAAAEAAGAASVLEAEPDIRALIEGLQDSTPALYGVFLTQFTGSVRETAVAQRRAQVAGDVQEAARLEAKLARLRSPEGNAAEANLYHDALERYWRLLGETDAALVALREAITAEDLPPIERATVFVRRATEMRLLAEGLRADLADLRELRAVTN